MLPCAVNSGTGYILGGTTRSFGSGNGDFWIIKVDDLGNQIWEKTVGGSQDDYLRDIKSTSDGGYICGGYST